jgi:uncharacterized protein YaiL (DUF2058 family)
MYPYEVLCDFEDSLVEKLGYMPSQPNPFWIAADGGIDYRRLPDKVLEIHLASYSEDERQMIFDMLNTYCISERKEKLYLLAYRSTVSKDEFASTMMDHFNDSNLEYDKNLLDQYIETEWKDVIDLRTRLAIYRAKGSITI